MNAEKYSDPTADQAVGHVMRDGRRELMHSVKSLIHCIRDVAAVEGFEIVGRVTVKHIESGEVFR